MRISKVSLFFYIIGFNYIFLRFVIFPFIYNNYAGNGIIYLIFFLFGVTTFFLFLPKKFFTLDFYTKFKESKIKYFFHFLFFIRILMGITAGCYVLHELFFFKAPYILLPLGIIFVILLLSSLLPSEVIQISTLFGIAIVFCYGFYLYNFIDLEFGLIFKDFKFDFNIMLFILPYCIIFDNLFYFIVDKDKLEMSKKTVVLSLTVAMSFLIFEYAMLVLSSGGQLYKDQPLVGFYALSIEPVTRYNGNFDYIYILMIVITCVFKFSYLFSLYKNSIKMVLTKKKYIFIFILLSALSMGFYYILDLGLKITNYFIIGSCLLGGIILLWMLKEVFHARKIKE